LYRTFRQTQWRVDLLTCIGRVSRGCLCEERIAQRPDRPTSPPAVDLFGVQEPGVLEVTTEG
jgi:hypothetical protein